MISALGKNDSCPVFAAKKREETCILNDTGVKEDSDTGDFTKESVHDPTCDYFGPEQSGKQPCGHEEMKAHENGRLFIKETTYVDHANVCTSKNTDNVKEKTSFVQSKWSSYAAKIGVAACVVVPPILLVTLHR
ncbi:hypothetical protein DPMN_091619 [Dreissena polymorpha]|uniref:Uncharacterized protein n=1 Tax=Dreissena polymorpha TaxID=45954 RepID=A0A9D4R048_DREPO|nr:hypothetical protein DPMN_091619 [Dreissena polymorpha]